MKRCTRCVMPNTRPGEWNLPKGMFNEEGICQACLNYEKRNTIDWDSRFKQLEHLADKYKRTDIEILR